MTAGPTHYWWLSDEPLKDGPWSRAMCDREQESRFATVKRILLSASWERVTCPDCLAKRP